MTHTVQHGHTGQREQAAHARELVRAELAGRELAARIALIFGLCAGTSLVASGIFDYTHAGRPNGTAATLSLVIGAALILATGVLLALLELRSRDRQRQLAAYGGPGHASQRELKRLRAAWTTFCCLALFFAVILVSAAFTEASKSGPYEEPDPTLYGGFLLNAAILTAAGWLGIRRAHRNKPGKGGKAGRAAGAPAPTNPQAALFSSFRSEPIAPHRLSPRLSARLRTLSRASAVTFATLGALLGSALTGTAALAPRALGEGTGLFWALTALTALYLFVLLLELTHYAPRRRHPVLLAFTGFAMLFVAWFGFSTSALLERGQWVTTEVTDVRHQSRGGPRCELRAPEGTPGAGDLSLSPCREAETGDRMRVFYDPEGVAPTKTEAPLGLTGFYTAWGTGTAVLVTISAAAALYGHRRRGELGLDTA